MISVEEKGFINVWDVESRKIIKSELMKFHPTCSSFSNDRKYLIFGTSLGSLRVFKINPDSGEIFNEISSIKFEAGEIIESFVVDQSQRIIAAKIKSSNKVYFCSVSEENEGLELFGFVSFEFDVVDLHWMNLNSENNIVILLKGGCLLTLPIKLSRNSPFSALTNLNSQLMNAFLRRIDPDTERIIPMDDQQGFLSFGPSVTLRKYRWPTDHFSKSDVKSKYPQSPIDEYTAFDLPPICWVWDNNRLFYATENGEFGLFDVHSNSYSTVSILSWESRTASCMTFINNADVAIGGFDGSIFVVSAFENYIKCEKKKNPLIFKETDPNKGDSLNAFSDKVLHSKRSKNENKDLSDRDQNSKNSQNESRRDKGEAKSSPSDERNHKHKTNKRDDDSENKIMGESEHFEENQAGDSKAENFENKQKSMLASKETIELPVMAIDYSSVVTSDINHLSESKVKVVEDLLYDQHIQTIKQEREVNRSQVLKILKEYKDELESLKKENEDLEDEFKLKNDEFCVDLEKQSRYKQLSNEIIVEIRNRAVKEVSYYEILHNKIKQETFNKMDVHLKGLAGFKSKIGVFNFPINKIEVNEQKIFKKMAILRRMEMKERDWIRDNGHMLDNSYTKIQTLQNSQMSVDQSESDRKFPKKSTLKGHLADNASTVPRVSNRGETYPIVPRILEDSQPEFLINGGFGKQKMILTDFEKREKELKEYEEERRKKKELLENTNHTKVVRKIELVNRRKRKKKNVVKNFSKQNQGTREGNRDSVVQSKLSKRQSKEFDKSGVLVFSTLELTTINKKVAQMYFIKHMVKTIKEEFNQSFDAMFRIREKQNDVINESTKKIREICAELQVEDQSIELTSNIIENVKNCLDLLPNEIGFEKYLSREARERIELEKKADEDKLKAMNADDTNQRA